MADENNNGGGGTDMTATNQKLDDIAKILAGDNERLFKDVAVRLYSNTNFSLTNKSAAQIADEAIERAAIFVQRMTAALS